MTSPNTNPFDEIERILRTDPCHRGVEHLSCSGDLEQAARSLAKATRVGIITGFYIKRAQRWETDGPPGALALSAALQKLKIDVFHLVDDGTAEFFEAMNAGPLVAFEPRSRLDPFPSHLVAIERPGRAADGKYYTMRGEVITPTAQPLDQLFLGAVADSLVTIAVGDGGNEMGMGKVHDAVVHRIPNGPVIASVVPADFLIASGTSNWGAWGLVAALSLVTKQPLLPT